MSVPGTGTETVTLLKTKLHRPRISEDLIPRPRLLERLQHGLERKLTLISAGAGFGKTTLLVQWLETCDRPVAWLSLDEADSDLVVFLSYWVAALQTVFPHACHQTVGLLRAPQLPPQEYLVATLINELAEFPEPFILVLDDYHRIHDDQVHEMVQAMIRRLPLQMHLVLASRMDPPFPLIGLRAGKKMTQIRADDLRFSFDEARAYLAQAVEAELSGDAVATLKDRTEGWIVGLRLAALSMRGLDDHQAFVGTFYGGHRDVVDYLVTEVISRQPPAVQEFLLRTSILDRFCTSLCDSILETGDWGLEIREKPMPSIQSPASSEAILNYLESANLFLIPLDFERKWWRYHHLFQELLQLRLKAECGEKEMAALHLRASAWYAEQGYIQEALGHALSAGGVEEAVRLVEGHRVELMNREDWPTLERWLGMLPQDVVRQRPSLSIARAWPMLYRFHLTGILPILEDTERCMQGHCESLPAPEERALRAEMDMLRSFVYCIAYDDVERGALHAKRALADLPITQTNARGIALDMLCLGHHQMGQTAKAVRLLEEALADPTTSGSSRMAVYIGLCLVHMSAADLRRLWQTAVQFLEEATEREHLSGIAWGNYFAGLARYEWNELGTAIEYFQKAIDVRYSSVFVTGHLSFLALALAYQAKGWAEESLECLDALRSFSLEMNTSEYVGDIDALQARLSLLQGDLASAVRWTVSLNPYDLVEPWPASEIQGLTWAEVRIAEGTVDHADEAIRYLQARLAQSQEKNNTKRAIQNLAHLALVFQKQGKTNDALDVLEQSILLSCHGGFVRTYVDLGPVMARLLYRLTRSGIPAEPRGAAVSQYVGRVLAAFPRAKGAGETVLQIRRAAQAGMVEPLTERESEVLMLLSEGLANKEIAQTLDISPLTVKRHITNINQKLGTGSRREAVVRARALGILPSD